jgi:5-methylcytosine-specific restriction protein A
MRESILAVRLPQREDFENRLRAHLREAKLKGLPYVDAEARWLHRQVGGYPNNGNHRMPICNAVMRNEMKLDDLELAAPPKGRGATLTIRYFLK